MLLSYGWSRDRDSGGRDMDIGGLDGKGWGGEDGGREGERTSSGKAVVVPGLLSNR